MVVVVVVSVVMFRHCGGNDGDVVVLVSVVMFGCFWW